MLYMVLVILCGAIILNTTCHRVHLSYKYTLRVYCHKHQSSTYKVNAHGIYMLRLCTRCVYFLCYLKIAICSLLHYIVLYRLCLQCFVFTRIGEDLLGKVYDLYAWRRPSPLYAWNQVRSVK
jgi:hypothetical protein